VKATIFVTPDYLAIGSDVDFVRVPVNFHTAQRIAHDYGFALPTRKMVDEIYKNARVVLEPQPLPPGNSMITNAYFAEHNKLIEAQGDGRYVPGMLIAGHKKDIVISNKLREKPEAIAIYGWHKSDDAPIQPLSTVHGARYVDYSHGVRLVSRTVVIDGRPASITDILANPETCSLLSDEGTIIGMEPSADEEVFFAGMKN
jgi:hypothetical protein